MAERASADRLLLTCEHAGARVPAAYRTLFEGAQEILATHRGHDLGALACARVLARHTRAPLLVATTTRLLVDLNRPEGARGLFSRFTRGLSEEEREVILDLHHRPHWQRVQDEVRRATSGRRRRIVHVGVHSFTPWYEGRERGVDVGLLHDPTLEAERAFCVAWAERLRKRVPGIRVHRNRPYYGSTPGMTTFLRRRFGAPRYLGIELEMNQRYVGTDEEAMIHRALAVTLGETLALGAVD